MAGKVRKDSGRYGWKGQWQVRLERTVAGKVGKDSGR